VVKSRSAELHSLLATANDHRIAVFELTESIPWREFELLADAIVGFQGSAATDEHGSDDELFSLANSIASTIGGSVAIEDMDRRMLAYSSVRDQRIDSIRTQGILDRRVPDHDRNSGQYRELLNAPGVVRFEEIDGEFARAAIAIRAGEQSLGSIWAIETDRGLDDEGELALLNGASRAALKILRMRRAEDPQLRQRNESLTRALEGTIVGSELAFRLALPGGTEIALIGFTLVPSAIDTETSIGHVASVIARFVAAYRPEAFVTTSTRSVYVLLPTGGIPAALRFVDASLLALYDRFPISIRCAVARSSSDPSDLPSMRSEIDDILRVTAVQLDLPIVAQLADVHSRVLLAHVSDQLTHSPRLRHPGVLAMSAYDSEHETGYVDSLNSWFDAHGDIGKAALCLGVHANTLRYRLRRIPELFEISLESPDDRLVVWMQLRICIAFDNAMDPN
jgi:PucR C-terminal helix-turn-helix domain